VFLSIVNFLLFTKQKIFTFTQNFRLVYHDHDEHVINGRRFYLQNKCDIFSMGLKRQPNC